MSAFLLVLAALLAAGQAPAATTRHVSSPAPAGRPRRIRGRQRPRWWPQAGRLPSEGFFLEPLLRSWWQRPADGATQANVFNDAPVFVQFSESLDPDSLENAFVLFDLIAGADPDPRRSWWGTDGWRCS